MSLLKKHEIQRIKDVYDETNSIAKTAQITGFSKITVNKYVKVISSQKTNSRNCKNVVYQLELETNRILKEWDKPSIACRDLGINPAEVCRVLKGELKQAGGFGWSYKKDYIF